MLLQKQIKISELDRVRTWKTLQFSESKFKNGVILKTEFNKSKINHNNTLLLLLFNNNVNQLVNKTIFLSFLIGKSYNDFSIQENDDSLNLNLLNNQSTTKSHASIEKLKNQNILLEQQILSQNKKFYHPFL